MIHFFRTPDQKIVAVETLKGLDESQKIKLEWLFAEAQLEEGDAMDGYFVGPRKEMITPWSTNAVEICQNMGLSGIIRIEEYFSVEDKTASFDPMLQSMYHGIDQDLFKIEKRPEPVIFVDDISAYKFWRMWCEVPSVSIKNSIF